MRKIELTDIEVGMLLYRRRSYGQFLLVVDAVALPPTALEQRPGDAVIFWHSVVGASPDYNPLVLCSSDGVYALERSDAVSALLEVLGQLLPEADGCRG